MNGSTVSATWVYRHFECSRKFAAAERENLFQNVFRHKSGALMFCLHIQSDEELKLIRHFQSKKNV